ncbi:hypothetical protein IW146_006153 [Coemansia sp. RSA 922]|nr:hypothetical protein IW146_006153 [Coemansia sp. RSA 922]
MSQSQPVQSPAAPAQLSATLGPMPPPRPVINRTEAQQARVTHLIDLMQQLVKQMDVFWEVQIQTPHIPQSATQVREILAVLLPEITTLGPELREHEQAQVMGMLHHVTQRVDAVSTAHLQATQVLKDEQATLVEEIEKLTDQEEKLTAQEEKLTTQEGKLTAQELMLTAQEQMLTAQEQMLAAQKLELAAQKAKLTAREERVKRLEKEQRAKKMPDLVTAALKAQLTMKSTLTECLAELDSELRKEMRKKYL